MNKARGAAPVIIRCGQIIGVHGVRGEVKAILELDDPTTLLDAPELYIGGRRYHLLAVRPHKQHYLLRFQEIVDRDQALALKGQELQVDPRWLPPLPAGEYYWYQIIGLAVHLATTEEYLGQVVAILPTAAHDVYVVQRGAEEFLIPAVDDVILQVDLENRRLLIAPEGWVATSGAD